MVDANVNLRSMKIVMPSLGCWGSDKKCSECGKKLAEERADVGHDRCAACEDKAKKAECCCVVC